MVLMMVAFNGMSFVVNEDATHADLRALMERRENQGYDVERLTPFQVEVTSDGLVDDNQGILSLRARSNVPKHLFG